MTPAEAASATREDVSAKRELSRTCTPEPALPSLQALLDSRHEVVAVLTRPDAPAGRGRRVVRSPVAALADEPRVQEVARMLGGIEVTARAREHAREMLVAAVVRTDDDENTTDKPRRGERRRRR